MDLQTLHKEREKSYIMGLLDLRGNFTETNKNPIIRLQIDKTELKIAEKIDLFFYGQIFDKSKIKGRYICYKIPLKIFGKHLRYMKIYMNSNKFKNWTNKHIDKFQKYLEF